MPERHHSHDGMGDVPAPRQDCPPLLENHRPHSSDARMSWTWCEQGCGRDRDAGEIEGEERKAKHAGHVVVLGLLDVHVSLVVRASPVRKVCNSGMVRCCLQGQSVDPTHRTQPLIQCLVGCCAVCVQGRTTDGA